MSEYDKTINKMKDNFINHDIITIHDSKEIQKYIFKEKNTGMFSMSIICSTNHISVTGDCGVILISLNSNRSGLGFLLSFVNNFYYFEEKIVPSLVIKTWEENDAIEAIKQSNEMHDNIVFETIEKFYESCEYLGIDEPWDIYSGSYKASYLNIIAGLRCFVEKYHITI